MSEAEKKRLEVLTSDENRSKFINQWVEKGHTIAHDRTAASNEFFGTKADPNAPPQPRPTPAEHQAARNQPRGRGQGPNRRGGQHERGGGPSGRGGGGNGRRGRGGGRGGGGGPGGGRGQGGRGGGQPGRGGG